MLPFYEFENKTKTHRLSSISGFWECDGMQSLLLCMYSYHAMLYIHTIFWFHMIVATFQQK